MWTVCLGAMLETMRIGSILSIVFLAPYFAIAGVIPSEGSMFQITDSDYLNISLHSTEIIKLRLESVPEMITMRIAPTSTLATSTQITITGLLPLTPYYKYEDNYHNLTSVFSNENGAYVYTQDISKSHRIFIQPRKSTKFISNNATGGDCASIGTWNPATLTCTLTNDLTETVQIDSDGITLDGGGHTMTGLNTGNGIYLYEKSGVTIKNLTIKNFSYGITLDLSSNNTVHTNTISVDMTSSNRYTGETLTLYDSNNNKIYDNSFSKANEALTLYNSSSNKIYRNTFSEAGEALTLYYSNDNEIYNNNFINNTTHLTDYSGVRNTFNLPEPLGGNYFDTFDEPAEGCYDANPDGFCDAPYIVYYTNGRDTLPWTKQNGWAKPPDPCAVPGSCVSNVLFLPGLEASRLYRPDYNGDTDQLWEPNTNSDANDLLLTADGKSVRSDVYTKDVIDEAYGTLNIYKSFIDQMNELKTAGTIADWKAAPYDWRLSLDDILNNGNELSGGRVYYAGALAATSSPYILQELRRLAKSSKTGKVTIVAHSNGGLVVKALTNKLGSEASNLIDKIIFVAVPQAGTPQAIGAILHGYEQGLPKDWFSTFLSPETARTIAENMPSAYNLLPSASYFTSISSPVATFEDKPILAEFRARYGDAIRNSVQLKNFITDTRRFASSTPSDLKYPSVGNATLLSRAETLHTTLDVWTPPQGVSLYEVAGWGEDTLATIEYKEGKKASCSDLSNVRTCIVSPAVMYKPKEVIDGDGTVVTPSALWTATATTTGKWWINLFKYNKPFFGVDRDHANILEVPELRMFIKNVLTNTILPPFTFISTTEPIADHADARLSFILHSPLNLSATDNLGNVISSATSTIPGSRFTRYGEVQVLKVPKGTPITMSLTGYATGSFTLDMEELDGLNNVTASTIFSAIPSATSTTATISFPNGTLETATSLLVDYDGNGTTDFSLKSKIGEEIVFDITPPEATLTFDPLLQQFKIIGTDNLSSTTVSTTATSTTITDEAGNTLQIVFKKLKQEKKELKVEIQELRYNGVSTNATPKTTLHYEWSTDKTGKLKELQEKATVGMLKIEAHYDAKKNVTKIKKKLKEKDEDDNDDKETKETFAGLKLLKLVTDKGVVSVDY